MENQIIDVRWEFVKEGIKDHHIANCIVIVILLLYGLAYTFAYLFYKLIT